MPELAESSLHETLEELLGRPVAAIRREPSEWATLFPADVLTVSLEGGDTVALFVKHLGSEEADHPEKQVRDREVRIYDELLRDPSLPVVRFYGATDGAGGHGSVLYLEHVDDWNLKHHDLEHWYAAARRLADLHRHFAARPELSAAEFLLAFDAGYFAEWAERALAGTAAQPVGVRARLATVVAGYAPAVELLESQPPTLVHNDLSPKNAIAVRGLGPARICFVDWEMAGIGCGLLDLVHLKFGLDAPEDARMRAAYCDALAGTDLLPPDGAELEALFAACELHKTLYRLSFAETWELPSERIAAWVADADALLGRIRAFSG